MCKRGTSSITDYLNHFKAICELLAAIQKSVSDDDKVMYILDGLDMVFVTSVFMRVPFPRFSELRSLLLAAPYKPMPASSTFWINFSFRLSLLQRSSEADQLLGFVLSRVQPHLYALAPVFPFFFLTELDRWQGFLDTKEKARLYLALH